MENKIYTDIDIPKSEVLRYLGHKKQEINENLDAIIDECIEESKKLINPKYVVNEYEIVIDDNVKIKNSTLELRGNDIKSHLCFADKIIIMAATLGSDIEKRIAFYEKVDMTKAVIMDSCATTAIEELCDLIDADIKKKALSENKGTAFRYSPGYGDLPLDIQGEILNLLGANKRIGLSASIDNILLPRKSVTAIIPVVPIEKTTQKKSCQVCANYERCVYRKEGVRCGN